MLATAQQWVQCIGLTGPPITGQVAREGHSNSCFLPSHTPCRSSRSLAHLGTQRVSLAVSVPTGRHTLGHNTSTQQRKPLICMSFVKFSSHPLLSGGYLQHEGFKRGQTTEIVMWYRKQIDGSQTGDKRKPKSQPGI